MAHIFPSVLIRLSAVRFSPVRSLRSSAALNASSAHRHPAALTLAGGVLIALFCLGSQTAARARDAGLQPGGSEAAAPASPDDTAQPAANAGSSAAPGDTGAAADNGASAGASSADGDSFKVQLITTPSPLLPGKNGLVTVRLSKLAGTSDSTPVHGATLVVRIRAEAAAPDSSWAIAHPTETAPGTYSFHAVFHAVGAYRVSVTVVPPIDEPFTAVVTMQVGPKADKNPPVTPGGTGGGGTAGGGTAGGGAVGGGTAGGGVPGGAVLPAGPASGDIGALTPAGSGTPVQSGEGVQESTASSSAGGVLPAVPGVPAPFTCNRKDPTTVRNLGVPLITEVVTYDRMTPAIRAEKLAARLNDCYVNDLKLPRTVTNMRQGNLIGDPNKTEYVFFGYLHPNGRDTADIIATVDPGTAAHYKVSPLKLACWWRDILRDWLLIDQGQPPRYTVQYTPLLMDFYKNLQAGQGDMSRRFLTAMSNLIDANDEYEKIARLSGQVPPNYRFTPDNYHPILNDDSKPSNSG